MLRKVAIAALVAGAVLGAWRSILLAPPPADVPIARLRVEAARGAIPYLTAPLPEWLPLPETGRVATASAYASQPPYGAAISLILAIDESAEAFAAAYEAKLTGAGYTVRRLPPPFDFSFTAELALDAYDPKTGRYVFCTLRQSLAAHSAQITFWENPAPRF